MNENQLPPIRPIPPRPIPQRPNLEKSVSTEQKPTVQQQNRKEPLNDQSKSIIFGLLGGFALLGGIALLIVMLII